MRLRHGLRLMANGCGRWFRPLTVAISHLPIAMAVACSSGGPTSKPTARNLLLITVDTLRADHVGAYGWSRARTPALDGLAKGGALFDRAYAAAPITLPSHATLMTGRYPPRHGSRDNGLRVSPTVPTLATELHARGFRTAAFVAAFPLDHQFGLNRGFDVYSDRLGRDAAGKPANERPASQVVDEAIAWLRTKDRGPRTKDQFFLWIHLFEPHAPYGDPSSPSAARARFSSATTKRSRRQTGRSAACSALSGRQSPTRSSSQPAITARRSASTANTRTASSYTTPRCASRC
jgi:arylsulfatase A-like enzyme